MGTTMASPTNSPGDDDRVPEKGMRGEGEVSGRFCFLSEGFGGVIGGHGCVDNQLLNQSIIFY